MSCVGCFHSENNQKTEFKSVLKFLKLPNFERFKTTNFSCQNKIKEQEQNIYKKTNWKDILVWFERLKTCENSFKVFVMCNWTENEKVFDTIHFSSNWRRYTEQLYSF